MQLRSTRNAGRIASTLGAMTATLLGAPAATASDNSGLNDDTSTDEGKIRVDTAVLFYQEDDSRLRAIEPVVSVAVNATDGSILTLKLTSDTLTGATPNGATPWRADQTFITPVKIDEEVSTTSASGNSVIITVPGSGVARQYVTPAGQLPLDYGFKDQRYAADIGYSFLSDPTTRWSFGGGYSREHDYRSIIANAGVAKELFDKRTTLSLSANIELDKSSPFTGVPAPLSLMSGQIGAISENKTVFGGVLGVSQVMNRRWLAQASYSIGKSTGYQSDPYRFISVVDPVTGAPVEYRYESRPDSRLRQSFYLGSKLAIGPTVTDISGRYYWDDWGISSLTGEIAERIPIGRNAFLEPHFRYYKQNKADFFRNFLVGGQTLPAYASSDSRLGDFSAKTIGMKAGQKLGEGELYVDVSRYIQNGDSHPADAIGGLAQQDLFTGVSATSVIVGYSIAFD